MTSILLNDTIVNGPSGPTLYKAGATISDTTILAALGAGTGVLWPSNDSTVSAAAAKSLLMRASKGADAGYVQALMIAAAAQSMAVNEGQVNTPVAALAATVDLTDTPVSLISPNGGGLVLSVYVVPSAALTADDTNFRTITLNKSTAGAASVAIASLTTKTTVGGGTGNWAAKVPLLLTFSLSPALVAPLDVLTLTTLHAAAGTAIPAFQLVAFIN